jgi:hypothetical protein
MRRFGRPEERVGHLLVLGGVEGAEIRTMTYEVALPLFRVEESRSERHGLRGGGHPGQVSSQIGADRDEIVSGKFRLLRQLGGGTGT